jgi:hypothetical protein
LEYAIGCRPFNEFVVERHRKETTRQGQRTILKCMCKECPVEREVRVEMDENIPVAVVYEYGNHLQINAEPHPPVHRLHYSWTQLQRKMLEENFAKNPLITPLAIKMALSEADLLKGATLDNIKGWLHRKRLSQRKSNKPDASLSDVYEILREFSDASAWDDDNPSRPLLLPIPDTKHILEGNDVREQHPKKTRFNVPYAFCLPLSTPKLLGRRIKARQMQVRVLKNVSLQDGNNENASEYGIFSN